jgi:NAD(P)-dependent dehydrogenase (short-subunit alcohol dehydrogenase family)
MPCVLVTGSKRNLGLGFARHYAAAGWRVIATCRNLEKAGDLEKIAKETDGKLSVHHMDMADRASIRALAGELAGLPIDVLINNAAIMGKHRATAFGETDYSEWGEIFAVNTFGPLMVAEGFAANVAASGRRVIATVSSRLGGEPTYGMVPYHISKTALNQVVMQIALALRERGIISVALHPGWVQNDIMPHAILTPDESAAMLAKVIGGLTMADTGTFVEPDGSALPLITQQFTDKPYSRPKSRLG